mgnify:FL=1
MIVWKGWGLLALAIPLVLSLLVGAAFDATYGENFYKNSEWAMPMVLTLSSVLLYFVGTKLNNKPGKILVDPENDEKIELKTIHSMFWIPIQYWAFIVTGISVWMYAANTGLIYQ